MEDLLDSFAVEYDKAQECKEKPETQDSCGNGIPLWEPGQGMQQAG